MHLTLRIREVIRTTPRARVVRLDLDGYAFDYAPGQAVLVGTHGQSKRRPYSIAAAPEDARRDGWIELLVGVDQEGNPGDHLLLQPGDEVDIEGPFGAFIFPADAEEGRFIFIAGGTGIAPLRAMLRHALRIPHREVGVFYSARAADEFAYEEELVDLARERRIELRLAVTRAVDETWTGIRGRIGRDELQTLVHDPVTLCFICGPPPLVEEMSRHLRELGIDRDRIRMEEWA